MEELLKEKYYLLVYEYLMKETKILDFDRHFTDSELNYQKIEENNKDDCQKKSPFDYFYVRNDLFVENLDEIQKSILEKIDFETEYNEKKSFVENTLVSVLVNKKFESNYLIPYGSVEDYGRMAFNGTLVIGFRYDEFFGYDDQDDEWADNLENQEDEIYEILPKIQREIEEKIKIPTKIIQYDDNSVKLNDGLIM